MVICREGSWLRDLGQASSSIKMEVGSCRVEVQQHDCQDLGLDLLGLISGASPSLWPCPAAPASAVCRSSGRGRCLAAETRKAELAVENFVPLCRCSESQSGRPPPSRPSVVRRLPRSELRPVFLLREREREAPIANAIHTDTMSLNVPSRRLLKSG